jgi:hypothetical protein
VTGHPNPLPHCQDCTTCNQRCACPGCTAPTVQLVRMDCRARYPRPANVSPKTRIIRCHLPAGHPGEHEEDGTEVTWIDPPSDREWFIPTPQDPARRRAMIEEMFGRGGITVTAGPPPPSATEIMANIRQVLGHLRQEDEAYQVNLRTLANDHVTAEAVAAYAIETTLKRFTAPRLQHAAGGTGARGCGRTASYRPP